MAKKQEHIVFVQEVGDKFKAVCLCGWSSRHTIQKYRASFKADAHVREQQAKEEKDA